MWTPFQLIYIIGKCIAKVPKKRTSTQKTVHTGVQRHLDVLFLDSMLENAAAFLMNHLLATAQTVNF